MTKTVAEGFLARPGRLRKGDRLGPASGWGVWLSSPKNEAPLPTDTQAGWVGWLTADHVDASHPWAVGAAGGDRNLGGYFSMYKNRTEPDRFAAAYSPNDDRQGDGFSWHPGLARWIATSRGPGSWDLDYHNPSVAAAVTAEIVSIANRGASAVALRGLSSTWRDQGMDSRNQPATHLVARLLATVASMAAPSVRLLAVPEPGSHPVPFHELFVSADQCRIGLDQELSQGIWSSFEAADRRALMPILERRFPSDCSRALPVKGPSPGDGLGEVDLRRHLAAITVAATAADIVILDASPHTPPGDDDALGPDGVLDAAARRVFSTLGGRHELAGAHIESMELPDHRLLAFRRGPIRLVANLSSEAFTWTEAFIPAEGRFDLVREETWDGTSMGPFEIRLLEVPHS
ncbi:MAG: hypothetical protein ACT4OP_11270 [Actinomycetota bacterium]